VVYQVDATVVSAVAQPKDGAPTPSPPAPPPPRCSDPQPAAWRLVIKVVALAATASAPALTQCDATSRPDSSQAVRLRVECLAQLTAHWPPGVPACTTPFAADSVPDQPLNCENARDPGARTGHDLRRTSRTEDADERDHRRYDAEPAKSNFRMPGLQPALSAACQAGHPRVAAQEERDLLRGRRLAWRCTGRPLSRARRRGGQGVCGWWH
jgi:hypothetical protein